MAVFDNGKAPSTEKPMVDFANVPRSSFNMSRVHEVTGIVGALMPIDVLMTLPNEDYKINYASMIESRNPLLKPLKSGLKVIYHTYYQKMRDIWEDWDDFVSRGKDGRITDEIPKLLPCIPTNEGVGQKTTNDLCTFVPCSPADYMGLPIITYDNTITNKNYCYKPIKISANNVINNGYGADMNNTEKWGINGLPFVMYEDICTEYYYNKNLLIKNKELYPNGRAKPRLSNANLALNNGTWGKYFNTLNGRIMAQDSSDYNATKMGEGAWNVPTNTNERQPLNMLHFRQWRGDYFNTANPFADLLRGDSSQLALDGVIDWSGIFKMPILEKDLRTDDYINKGTSNVNVNYENSTSNTVWGVPHLVQSGNGATFTSALGVTGKSGSAYYDNVATQTQKLNDILERAKITGLTLNNLRKKLVLEKFMERNACTDGSYKEFIKAQFGYTPNVHDCKPIYIGGFTQDINSDAVQNTTMDANGVIGQKGGQLYGASMGNIGSFHSDDYGIIMTIACIVPDTYYDNQGIDTMWTNTKQEDIYIPLMNNLEPQAIKNKELFVSGDETYDEDVWGYANRFEDMKSRRNIVSGFGACGNKAIEDSQGYIKRRFEKNNKPALNMQFLTMSPGNIDLVSGGFTSANEPPFKLTIGCCIDKVSPMPTNPMPSDLGIRY